MASMQDLGLSSEVGVAYGSEQLKGYMTFLKNLLNLRSMPIFIVYIIMIMFRSTWQQYTKPLSLRPLMVLHNAMCCIFSLITLLGFIYGFCYCSHIYDKNPSPVLIPSFFLFWVCKTIEVLDTVFMLIRHKQGQMSFLHVYHHSSMLLLSEYAYRFVPWPAIAPFLAINSFIHVVLYLYYGLKAWNPNININWKENLTQLQILQFFIDFVFAFIGYLFHGFCFYSLIYGAIMVSLFMNFYHKAYMLKRPVKSE